MSVGSEIQKRNQNAGIKAFIALALFVLVLAIIWFVAGDRFFLWLKAFHIIAVISWMAGLLYLPRLFINHCSQGAGSDAAIMLAGMEQRLMKIIMTPAMILSWIFGLWLAYLGNYWAEIWFITKFFSVILMTCTHFYFAKSIKNFKLDKNSMSSRSWRLINEVPTVLMILVVIMVIVKPFA